MPKVYDDVCDNILVRESILSKVESDRKMTMFMGLETYSTKKVWTIEGINKDIDLIT